MSHRLPLMFGPWIIPWLNAVVLGGFGSNLAGFCHAVMKDSLLVLARCLDWLTRTGEKGKVT